MGRNELTYAPKKAIGYTYILEAQTIPSKDKVLPFGDISVTGNGFLSSEYPVFITSVEGVPTSCEVRVLLHRSSGQLGDGVVVATTQSGQNGVWMVTGLNPELHYDVVCRHAGYNDMILSNIQPVTT